MVRETDCSCIYTVCKPRLLQKWKKLWAGCPSGKARMPSSDSSPGLKDSHITALSLTARIFMSWIMISLKESWLLRMRTLAVSVCHPSVRRLWCERNFPIFNQHCWCDSLVFGTSPLSSCVGDDFCLKGFLWLWNQTSTGIVEDFGFERIMIDNKRGTQLRS